MRARFFLLPFATLALAACQQQSQEPAARESASAPAAPEAKPGLSLTDGALVLPAVKGNPGVAYFTLTNGADKAATLAGVHVEGAGKTEMHETRGGMMSPVASVDIEPGASVKFERGGLHVMLFDLAGDLAAGGTTEMTLTFADGDKLSAPLGIQAAGAGHGGAH